MNTEMLGENDLNRKSAKEIWFELTIYSEWFFKTSFFLNRFTQKFEPEKEVIIFGDLAITMDGKANSGNEELPFCFSTYNSKKFAGSFTLGGKEFNADSDLPYADQLALLCEAGSLLLKWLEGNLERLPCDEKDIRSRIEQMISDFPGF